MGVVYRAHDSLLERVVALKVIATTINENLELRERFFREARAAGQLSHPNVITIHDLGEHEGQPYLAMEYLVGEDLQRRLTRTDPMSLARKVQIASEICDGLSFAHRRGVIHRDIKPANIFIADDGVVKILDFGLARMVASEVTASNMMLGTLNYMAPEQVRGERIDHRADIFSYGALFYEILSGRKAFQGDSYATTLYKILQETPEPLPHIDPSLPQELVRIVDRALAKSRDERYQDLTDVAVDLALLKQQLTSALPQTSARPASTLRVHGVPSGSVAFPQSGPESETTTAFTQIEPPARLAEPPPPARRQSMRPYAAALVIGVVALAGWLAFGRSTPPRTSTPPLDLTAPPPSSPAAAGNAERQPAAQPAAPEAKPPEPALESSAIDDARTRMLRAKSAATGAGADARRSTVYSAALTAEREAHALQRAGRLPEATAKFYEASGLFTSALVPASSGPTPPPASPPPPPSSTAAPAGSPAASSPSPSPSTGAATPPANASPSTSSPPPVAVDPLPSVPPGVTDRLPTPPPVPADPPSSTSAEDALRALVRRYEQALETRNIDALKRVWPSLGGAQEDAIRREFEHARSIEVTIDSPAIAVSGATATVTFNRRYQLQTVDGQRPLTNSRTTIAARRAGSEWVIESVRFQTK